MKKILLTLLSVFLIASQLVPVNAESSENMPSAVLVGDEVRVSGTTRSHKSGEQVTIAVLKPSKSTNDLDGLAALENTGANISDSILYFNIAVTETGGRYEFSFNLGETDGIYKIYIRDVNDSILKELYVYKYDNIKAEVNLGEVSVTGNVRSHKANEAVTIFVLYPGKTLNDLKNGVENTVFYTNTISTELGGKYKFDFKLGHEKGDYNIYISDINNNDLTQLYVARDKLIDADIGISNIGNICFDYTTIPIRCELFADADADIDIKTDIYDAEDNMLLGTLNRQYKTDEKGFMDEYLNLNLSSMPKVYGLFKAVCTITEPRNGESITKEIKFSCANPAQSGMNNKMGTQHHFDYYGLDYNKDVIDLFTGAGYSFFRSGIHWKTFEDNGFKLNEEYESYIKYVTQSGGRFLLTLSADNSTYYDRDKEGNIISRTPSTTTSFEAFGRYCYNLALEVKKYTHEYEVLNEFNMDGSGFNPSGHGPDNYVELMKIAYENIHKADPDAIVYGIDAAYVTSGYKYTTYEWIEEVMKIMQEKKACYMDALSFHIYTATRMPEAANKVGIVKNVRDILTKYGHGDMRIVLTETGYSTNSRSERQQAKFELRDWALLYDSVDKLNWYNSIEKDDEDLYEHGLGHIRMNESTDLYQVDVPSEAKPVFLAMSNWNALLANSELIEKNVSAESVYDYVFKTIDGERVHMVWNANETPISKEFDIGASSVIKYDMYGNPQRLNSESGIYTISITDEPIYLAEPTNINIEFSSGDTPIKRIGAYEEISVNVNINETQVDLNDSTKLIIASYKDECLTDVSIEDVSKDKTSISKKVNSKNADRISVMLWDNMKPIRKSESIYK